MLALCLLTMTGCITIGPRVETRYVIVHPGQPLRVMENTTLSGERLDGAGPAKQDVGGWIMMPPDHWAVLERIIKASQPPVARPTP